ncbi:ATPase associated with various cellular activities family protein [Rhodococcus sp. MTM3W5.2]|uniref:ATP-binding protein n=1 Tax=Rhodococcus sp. MTM3W5.2 TaxID=1805827 RepID=UPI0009795C85|nr:ATP-binding protein [Rhodococcus sp. MTM3W5.2]AQA23909.1 ATPase associated with various cellular activities family protein [Rhodococcus sp. MTM3W5.2]
MSSVTEIRARPYEDGFGHLADHLRVLDRRIGRSVAVLRTSRRGSGLDARNHVFVSDDEVDRLLRVGILVSEESSAAPDAGYENEIAARVAASTAEGVDLPLDRLTQIFSLSSFERDALVICLAPEIDRRYDRLYAYLQDDATRKRPSVDLILRLLVDSAADAWRARALLGPDTVLRRGGILRPVDGGYHLSGSTDLARFLKVDDRILRFLQGHDTVDDALIDAVTVMRPKIGLDEVLAETALKSRLTTLVDIHLGRSPQHCSLILDLHGFGQQELAEGVCADLDCSLTVVHAARWVGCERDVPTLLPLAFRECLLRQGIIYVDGVDALARSDPRILAVLGRAAAACSPLTFLGTESPLRLKDLPDRVLYHAMEVPRPGAAVQEAAWLRVVDPAWAATLAATFTFTPRQIAAVVDETRLTVQRPSLDDLFAACRSQCQHQLSDLATKIAPGRSHRDLVLPQPQLDQLDELCAQVRNRDLVCGEWGFGQVMSRSRGVSTLLVGVPGTGKTMAAEVVAGALGVDLFAIDLSAVVSKYIGETEKNLAEIFRTAEHSNAILFFDEADALFGKRTEVSDAHDRYANIETSYLLQKMEQYDGVVILATNLRENMDEAFTRRLRFVIEFPFPDEVSRARIWQAHLPEVARIAADVDAELLAQQYPLSGAGIRNAAITAAFAAVEDGAGVLALRHIQHGIRREYEKIGKLWTEPIPHWRAPSGTD